MKHSIATGILWVINLAYIISCIGVFAASRIDILKPFLKYGKTLKNENNVFFNVYVPKHWFTHFYIIHFTLSWLNFVLFWNYENCFQTLHAIICINCMQSSRRLYECFFVSKFSAVAKIHIFHYLVGIFFYTSINIIPYLKLQCGDNEEINSLGYISLLLFMLAYIDQYYNHMTLSKQKKYNLPQSGLFKYVTCPHYFDEIIIYASCFLLDPSSSYFFIVLWVMLNLSISANQSYIFYKSQKQLRQQLRIIPFMY